MRLNKEFESNKAWKTHGRGFSMDIIQAEGKVIHFAGQVVWDFEENITGKDDFTKQTHH